MKYYIILLFGLWLMPFTNCQIPTDTNKYNSEVPPPPPEPPIESGFVIVDQRAIFSECDEIFDKLSDKQNCSDKKMMEFIHRNIKYPPLAMEYETEGTVVMAFVVTKDGRMKDIEVVRELGEGCSEEALRVMKLMKNIQSNWIPAKHRGRLVDYKYTIPINFSLTIEKPIRPPPPPIPQVCEYLWSMRSHDFQDVKKWRKR